MFTNLERNNMLGELNNVSWNYLLELNNMFCLLKRQGNVQYQN